jgi:hypothetical protein
VAPFVQKELTRKCKQLKEDVEKNCKATFMSSVLNLYRGNHSTDQKFLFDAENNQMHFSDGNCYELDTKVFRRTRSADCNTKRFGDYAFDGLEGPPGQAERVEAFFRQIFPMPEIYEVAHMALGLLVSTDMVNKFFFNFSDVLGGSNGKTQLAEAIRLALGSGDGGMIYTPPKEFLFEVSGGHANEQSAHLLPLNGCTACIMEEISSKKIFDSPTLKLVGHPRFFFCLLILILVKIKFDKQYPTLSALRSTRAASRKSSTHAGCTARRCSSS